MNTLTSDQTSAIEDAAYELDGEIYRGYSGRNMYGEECVGVVLEEMSDLFRFAGLLDDDLVKLLGSPRWDNMGLQYIAYWPRWTVGPS